MTQELLPCPFCGGEAKMKNGGPGSHWAQCSQCFASTNDHEFEHGVAAWNRRAPRWQPIETAPKDGTLIDVWCGGEFPRFITDVSWREPTDSEWWVHGGDSINSTDADWFDVFGPLCAPPTHWMPPPEPPVK